MERGGKNQGIGGGVAGTRRNHTSLSLSFGIALMYRPTVMYHMPQKEKKNINTDKGTLFHELYEE